MGLAMRIPLAFSLKHLSVAPAVATLLVIGCCRLAVAQQGPPPPMDGPVPSAPLPPDQLEQLVAPIALYPDALVAQILAAATYPTQIVEAERFIEQNPGLSGPALASAVDQQDWDPSVKALTQFPSVLDNMNQNLSWTSELGDVNYNQQADVMQAIQYMRQQAQNAGNLNSGPQQTVSDDDGDVEIEPANPDVVYVPEYDPEMVYGYPVGLWPGFDPWWTVGTPYLSFGIGFGMGPYMGYGWGWRHWGCGWGRDGGLMYGGQRYFSRSHAFYDHNAFMRGNYRGVGGPQHGFVDAHRAGAFGGGNRTNGFAGNGAHGRGIYNGGNRAGAFGGGNRTGAFGGGNRSLRGFGGQGVPSVHTGAFGGFGRGGDVRAFQSRGFSSMGGGMRGGFGGGMRGGFGGGGMHGGGIRR